MGLPASGSAICATAADLAYHRTSHQIGARHLPLNDAGDLPARVQLVQNAIEPSSIVETSTTENQYTEVCDF
jgi:hypothetical protein